MIVAIINQTSPSGLVKVADFWEAVDQATAVTEFAAAYSVTAGDYLGYDTGWTAFQSPGVAKHWEYDFDSPALVAVDNAGLLLCHTLLLGKDDIAITSDGSWEVLGRFVLNPEDICSDNDLNRFVLRPRFAYRSTGGTPQLRIVENAAQYGNVAQFTDETGWTRDKFRAAGTAAGGTNTYTLEGDRNGATLFELRGVTIDVCKRE
jgi:hypothetical protein